MSYCCRTELLKMNSTEFQTPQTATDDKPQIGGTRANNPAVTEYCELPVTGMTCAACAARIEKNLKRAPGVKSAAVNFATNRARIDFDPRATDQTGLIEVVRDSGYGVPETGLTPQVADEPEGDWEK